MRLTNQLRDELIIVSVIVGLVLLVGVVLLWFAANNAQDARFSTCREQVNGRDVLRTLVVQQNPPGPTRAHLLAKVPALRCTDDGGVEAVR